MILNISIYYVILYEHQIYCVGVQIHLLISRIIKAPVFVYVILYILYYNTVLTVQGKIK